jgi:pilus assembly protein FimV
LLLGAANAEAIGLGRIEVQSRLNEPFHATIPIVGAGAAYNDAVFAFLADPDQFRKMGVERRFVLATLKFEVVQDDEQGPQFVKVTSNQPIREPFLDILLELTSPEGRLVQQYTVLLDPAPVGSAVGTPSSGGGSAAIEAAEPATGSVEEPVATTAGSGGPAYGPVTADDTLWSIAESTRPSDGVSIQQMMLAIVKANPDAFEGGNINGLRRGHTLRIPTPEEIDAIPPEEALAEVQRQSSR